MRVIAGSARGIHLKGPEGPGTRPMTDRVKESLFGTLASLGYPQDGDRVLDLYAGTGALGIEALSRGAAWADFVEHHAGAARIIAANLAASHLAAQARVHVVGAQGYLQGGIRSGAGGGAPAGLPRDDKYDIIFMDPPYADPAIVTILELLAGDRFLAPEGLLVVGHATAVALPETPGTLGRIRHKLFGGSAFSLYR
ncbi:MAG TPA: 16S rRNA (guanine(966)-N(2))-methyltransferase RsmD, partial [Chloroflexia bacterium]|nr:16S rRNA (guanine(966)-N(2))-methyltransferase RsmD [Chloroflexia bacterium]